jgi:hypothetical protein
MLGVMYGVLAMTLTTFAIAGDVLASRHWASSLKGPQR